MMRQAFRPTLRLWYVRIACNTSRGSLAGAAGRIGKQQQQAAWPGQTRPKPQAVAATVAMAASRSSSSFAASPDDVWWSADTVALVTGANKGIGYEIAHQLADEGITTILTARDAGLGVEAKERLEQEGVPGRVRFHRLDLEDRNSIDKTAEWVDGEYGGLDILVNNAGFAYKGDEFGPDQARKTIAINVYGTMAVCERFKPLLRKSDHGARIVNVASSAGKLSILKSDKLRKKFEDPNLTTTQLRQLMEDFIESIKDGTYAEKGWPRSMYGVSKLGVATYTRILARELKDRGVLVNACDPGYVKTDMSSQRGYKTPAEGADTAVWLALLPKDGLTDKMCADRKEVSF
eukprot:jgi/Chlat1/7282/Chrsp58S09136